eukprot:CAMPEP_0194080112 /NCGR_PEP_ID=MMETSP0149-20130528/6181_1 /TAXON_ID=122233 /ORGANISM="Chaetoceros debilis, Strain MM31A-1" /LENGTH=742 /DNA_ID=CAMNT_0038761753 /DNA_START=184 /DNA_END=2413 /DNA_ORIENTATION=+
MSGWDDLFASAAGLEGSSHDHADNGSDNGTTSSTFETASGSVVAAGNSVGKKRSNSSTKEDQKHQKKKKKKRRQKNIDNDNDNEDEDEDDHNISPRMKFLNSRMDPIPEQIWANLPDWLLLEGRFGGTRFSDSDDDDSKEHIGTGTGNDNKNKSKVKLKLKLKQHRPCKKWKPFKNKVTVDKDGAGDADADADANANADDNKLDRMKCKYCFQSALHHSLQLLIPDSGSSSDKNHSHSRTHKDDPFLVAFCHIRNVRCCCSCILEKPLKLNTMEYVASATDNAKSLAQTSALSRLCNSLPPGEAEILRSKLESVLTNAKKLKKSAVKWNNTNMVEKEDKALPAPSFPLAGFFDDLVRLVIKCDDAYYRLYYLQNAGYYNSLRYASIDWEQSHCQPFIPHPPTYFGTSNMAWNVTKGKERMLRFYKSMQCNKEHESMNEMLVNAGMFLDKDAPLKNEFGDKSTLLDPLSFLHQNRHCETVSIFWKSGWLRSPKTMAQTSEAMQPLSRKWASDTEEAFYRRHSTPAPLLLSEWRDSCRDLLCNLYAYAALSPAVVQALKKSLVEQGIQKVIEMGAGTGYIATLLSGTGVTVAAYDISPTEADVGQDYGPSQGMHVNDYHGNAPPFCKVTHASSKNTAMFFPDGTAQATALLLCYPPPMSSMAEDTILEFLRIGGRTIVHIGEFRGLTGSEGFENILANHFQMCTRLSCLRWGTDAANVAILSKIPSVKKSTIGGPKKVNYLHHY